MDLGTEDSAAHGQAVTLTFARLGLRIAAPHSRPRLFLPPLASGADAGSSRWGLYQFPGHTYPGIPVDLLAVDVIAIIEQETVRRVAQDADLPSAVSTGPENPGDLAPFATA